MEPPAHRMAIVLTWPDDSLTVQAARWLARHFRPDRIAAVCRRGPVDVVRCGIVADVCLAAPAEVSEFLFLDRDMRPCEHTDVLLHADADVVGALYPTACGPVSWIRPDDVHCGCLRVRRTVLERLTEERGPDACPTAPARRPAGLPAGWQVGGGGRGWPRPLFAFTRSPDGARLIACECDHFRRRVLTAGFRIARAGWCDHRPATARGD